MHRAGRARRRPAPIPRVRRGLSGRGQLGATRPRARAGPARATTPSTSAGWSPATARAPVLHGVDLDADARRDRGACSAPTARASRRCWARSSGLLAPGARRHHVRRRATCRRSPPIAACARGLVLVPEGRQVFPELSGARQPAARRLPPRRRASPRDVEAMLARFPRLRERVDARAGLLSGRRAADAGDRPGLMAQPAPPAARRALAGPRARSSSSEIFEALRGLARPRA